MKTLLRLRNHEVALNWWETVKAYLLVHNEDAEQEFIWNYLRPVWTELF